MADVPELPDPTPYVEACRANLKPATVGAPSPQIICSDEDFDAAVGAGMRAYLTGYLNPPPPALAPIVESIEPSSAVVGGPDLVLHVFGTGFTPATVILFNNGEEPTTFVSEAEVTTVVKPSTASGPVTVPVSVVGAGEEAPFEFTAPF